MRRALIGILMAATVASPLAAQTSGSSTKKRSGFGARVQAAIEEREERQEARTEQSRERREDRSEQRQDRRDDRQEQRQERREDRREDRTEQRQERSRSWGQNINRAIRNEERQDRQRERLERQAERERYRDWRRDSRYDWYRYRNYNRGLYGGSYYAPIWGSRYNRVSIGVHLGSPFYSNRYWINDPWQYRLPPAYPGTRWVRYYDDVVLVDMYDGQVIDVIHNFFW